MNTNGKNKPQGYIYKKGDVIGKRYQVLDILGTGGFGVAYLVFSHETWFVCALKALREEHIGCPEVEERFVKEAQVWVELWVHPYLVTAYFVERISDRLYIGMECIHKDKDGFNSLEGYLRWRPPNLTQSLHWAIQFCYGMEYAYSKGIQAHRDIKPANIMITSDKTVKISDFGLAGVLSRPAPGSPGSTINLNIREGRIGLSWQTLEGESFGTPTHMPPEQFTDAAKCDQRSDIYSFGVVLYQMATGGKLPFLASLPKGDTEDQMICFWREMDKLHRYQKIPRIDSPLFPPIQRCLEKAPSKRYSSFRELREDLEQILLRSSGETVNPPNLKELEAESYNTKASSLLQLDRFEEAIESCDRAIMISPRWELPWVNKGCALKELGHQKEALECYDKAIEINPKGKDAWVMKGRLLTPIGRYEEAIECCDRAIGIDDRNEVSLEKMKALKQLGRGKEAIDHFNNFFRNRKSLALDVNAWTCKADALFRMGYYEKAIQCIEEALEINPQKTETWINKAVTLEKLGRDSEALECCVKVLLIEPVNAWALDGIVHFEDKVGRLKEAIQLYDEILKFYPNSINVLLAKGAALMKMDCFAEAITCWDTIIKMTPNNVKAWFNRGWCFLNIGLREQTSKGRTFLQEAIFSLDKALQLDPQNFSALLCKGRCLSVLALFDEAISYFDKALNLDPNYFDPWAGKGMCLLSKGNFREAILCLNRALELNPGDSELGCHEAIEYARRRLHELG